MSTSMRVKVPTWDGKCDTYDTYKFKLTAFAAIKKQMDALDEIKMATCITQSKYNARDERVDGCSNCQGKEVI
jgi:hypothetical protein